MELDAALKEEDKTPAPVDPFDMAPIKVKFADADIQIDSMVVVADAQEVTDDESQKDAIAKAGQAKTLNKSIEAQYKLIVGDPQRFVKSVRGFCNNFQDRLETIERGLKKKIGDYQTRQEMARREAEKAAQEVARELQDKINKEAKEKNIEPVKVPPPVLPEAKKVARSNTGASASQRKEWTFEVIDASAVTREYCVVDPDEPETLKLIRLAVKAGVRQIPGVRIYEESKTVIRSS